ncbi:MAG: response regulator [Gammaproteobacteria bacterium]|nr:response regulator [Gammaproteobacteria bacterium]MDH5730245.1 response regulator [Gammaproteobacteria bacterium]
MSNKYRILVVDDEELNFDLMKVALKTQFELSYAPSGQEALEKAKTEKPDVILLDIQMPGMDGYETCRQLKYDAETSGIPVTFVSALDSLDEKLTAYDAGGDDYIVKPFEAEELQRKVTVSLQKKQEQEKLRQDVSTAMDTALQAITNTGEIGIGLNFLSRSFSCADQPTLAKSLIEVFGEFGLRVFVQIYGKEGMVELDTDGVVSQLQSNLLTKARNKGRLLHFGARTICNFDRVSVLFKNMPIEDEDRYGRYKDNIALIVEGANARVKAIDSELEVKRQQSALLAMINTTREALADIDMKYHEHKTLSTRILENLVTNIEEAFISLDLTEQQEERLLQIVSESSEKALTLYDEGLEVDNKLAKVMQQLRDVLGNQAA